MVQHSESEQCIVDNVQPEQAAVLWEELDNQEQAAVPWEELDNQERDMEAEAALEDDREAVAQLESTLWHVGSADHEQAGPGSVGHAQRVHG